MIRASWCGQVAAPKAIAKLAFSRRLGARPSAPPTMNTTAGWSCVRQPCSRPAWAQDHGDGAVGNDIGDGDRFLEHAPAGVAGAALPDLDDIEGLQAGAA